MTENVADENQAPGAEVESDHQSPDADAPQGATVALLHGERIDPRLLVERARDVGVVVADDDVDAFFPELFGGVGQSLMVFQREAHLRVGAEIRRVGQRDVRRIAVHEVTRLRQAHGAFEVTVSDLCVLELPVEVEELFAREFHAFVPAVRHVVEPL